MVYKILKKGVHSRGAGVLFLFLVVALLVHGAYTVSDNLYVSGKEKVLSTLPEGYVASSYVAVTNLERSYSLQEAAIGRVEFLMYIGSVSIAFSVLMVVYTIVGTRRKRIMV